MQRTNGPAFCEIRHTYRQWISVTKVVHNLSVMLFCHQIQQRHRTGYNTWLQNMFICLSYSKIVTL